MYLCFMPLFEDTKISLVQGIIRMTERIQRAFYEELRGFFALAVMNIVFAALTMAFGISIVVTQVFPMLEAGEIQIASSAYLLLGGIAAIVGLWWLPKSAEVLGDVADIREEVHALNDRVNDDESLRLMIGMMALYRDRKETVQRMVLISRVGGAIFLLSGVFNLIRFIMLVTRMGSAMDTFALSLGIIGMGITVGMGGAALLISFLFGKYSAAWEARLAESTRAEAVLTRSMEQE
jgi:hypothetical protein